jgi:hypothetical protein
VALGVPTVTNEGPLTEPIWRQEGCVELTTSPEDLARATEGLLRDSDRRAEIGERGRLLYAERFSLDRTIRVLRGTSVPEAM